MNYFEYLTKVRRLNHSYERATELDQSLQKRFELVWNPSKERWDEQLIRIKSESYEIRTEIESRAMPDG